MNAKSEVFEEKLRDEDDIPELTSDSDDSDDEEDHYDAQRNNLTKQADACCDCRDRRFDLREAKGKVFLPPGWKRML
jgi:hypothetical protein